MTSRSHHSAVAAPGVSIVLPTYQRRELVRRAVESVLAQTYRDFELIVVDDGSTDGTREALEGVDKRLRYHWQPNRGVAAARNAGLRLARGSIVAFLDSDNRWLPDHLAVVTEMLTRHPGAVLASTSPQFIVAGRQQPWDAHLLDSWEQLSVDGIGAGFVSCLAARRDSLVSAGGFDERLLAGEDTDLLLRLRCLGPFVTVRRQTIVRHATSGSLTDRARRAGHYLDAYLLTAENLAAAAENLPEPERGEVSRQARCLIHLSKAMLALDRGNVEAVNVHTEEACRLFPVSDFPGLVEPRTRCHLTRAHDPGERLRALNTLIEVWPDRRSDTARYLRAAAISVCLRLGRPGEAARLLAGWPRGGTLGFARRVAPLVQRRLRRRWQEHRHRARESAELTGSTTAGQARPSFVR